MSFTPEQLTQFQSNLAKAKKKGVEVSAESKTQKLEREIHQEIIEYLNSRGWWFIHSRTDQRTTQAKGVPDFVISVPKIEERHSVRGDDGFCYNVFIKIPKTLWIEVKRANGKPSKEQTETLLKLQIDGQHAAIVHSLDEFLEVLKGWGL